jgi:hypothetical protein
MLDGVQSGARALRRGWFSRNLSGNRQARD